MSFHTETVTFIHSVNDLRSVLEADARRDVYECQDGAYAVSYQGGEVAEAVVAEAIKAGILRSKYEGETRFMCWRLAA